MQHQRTCALNMQRAQTNMRTRTTAPVLQAEGWYDAQHVEAGEPLGTGQWGDHQPFGHQQVGGGAVADGAALVCTSHAPARDSVPQVWHTS